MKCTNYDTCAYLHRLHTVGATQKDDQKVFLILIIASCRSILQYFRPSLSYHSSLRSLFCLFLSGRSGRFLLYLVLFLWLWLHEFFLFQMTSPRMTSPVGSPAKPLSLPVSSPKTYLPPFTVAPMTSATSGLPPASSTPVTSGLSLSSGLPPLVIPPQSLLTSVSKPPTPQSQPPSQPVTPTGLGPIRRRVSDKCNLPISAGKSANYLGIVERKFLT